ncbi:ABC transporter ATP-binding protein [Pelagibacterales bacterium SAG-MED08]|nr:ABC transporter ATP-binding protein [Pelagibacterales bacterium SAG-MED08]
MLKILIDFYRIYLFQFKKKIIFIQIISVLNSVLQLLSILSFGPLILFFSGNEILSKNKYLNFILNQNIEAFNLVFIVAIIFVLSNLLNIYVAKVTLKTGHQIGAILGNLFFKQVLSNNLINENSKNFQIINSLNIEITRITNGIIIPLLYISSKFSNVFFIFLGLIIINFQLAFVSLLFLLSVYLIILYFFRKRFKINSEIISYQSSQRQKIISESIYNFRETIIFKLEDLFIKQFNSANKQYFRGISKNQFLSSVPRNIIEIFLFSILIYLIYFLYTSSLLMGTLPIIGIYIVALYKLLPSLQNIASSYASIKSNINAWKNVLPIISKKEKTRKLDFKNYEINKIEISNLNFSFGSKIIFQDTSINLEEGKIIGIVGTTGIGKTTFFDLLCGFLQSKKIRIKINNNKIFNDLNEFDLKSHVSLVTQKPLVLNNSVIKNISFEEKENVDQKKIEFVSKICDLDFIENLPNKWNTIIGEKNSQLSSGQIQRISIARAIYSDNKILLLDEPTNNLDPYTEDKIMNNLTKLKKGRIIILISHNLENLKNCDKVYKIHNKKFEEYVK